MKKIFEYKIEVDSTEVDIAQAKIDKLSSSMQKSSKDVTKSITEDVKTVGDAVGKSGKAIDSLGTKGASSFKGLGKGFKGLSSATKKFGAVLKANPLFTLIGIVNPLITLIKKFMDELGLLTVITNTLSAAMDYLVGLFKSLADWLGITDFAGTERGRNAAAASLEAQVELEKEIKLQRALQGQLDKTEDLQREYQRLLTDGIPDARKQLEYLEEDFEINSKRLEKRLDDERALREAAGQAQADQSKVLADAKARGDEKEIEAEQKKYDDIKAIHAGHVLNVKNINQELLQLPIQRNIDELNLEKKGAAEKKVIRDKEAAEAKARHNERLAQLREELQERRKHEDLQILLIEDVTEREILQNKTKNARLLEQALENDLLTEEERLKLKKYYADLDLDFAEKARKKKEDAEKAEEAKKVNRERDLQKLLLENRLAAVVYEAEQIAEITAETSEEERQAIIAKLQAVEDAKIQIAQESYNLEKEALDQALENKELTQEEHDAEMERLAMQHAKRMAEIRGEMVDTSEKAAEKEIFFETEKGKAIMAMSQGIADAVIANAEEGSKDARNFAAAATVVETIRGATMAFMSAQSLGPILGPIVGAANAAATAALGFGNVKKILAGDEKADVETETKKTNISAASASAAAAEFNFFGNANETGGDSSQFDVIEGGTETPPIRAVVSWTDIDAVGKADSNIRREMQL